MRNWPLSILFSAALLSACSDDNEKSSRDSSGTYVDTGTTAGADLSLDISADGAVAADVQEETGGQDVAVISRRTIGLVTVFEIRSPSVDALNSGGVGAGFVAPVADPEDEPPPVAEVDLCTVSLVDADTNPFDTGPTLDAGVITVEIGEEQIELTIVEEDDGPHYRANVAEDRREFFIPGLTIRFSATGGTDILAFSGPVSAPRDPVISSPEWTDTNGQVAANAELPVIWAGTSQGEAIINILPVQIFPEPGIGSGNAITCIVPDSGSYTVPAEALSYFSSESPFGPNAAITVVVASNSQITTNDHELTMNATASHTVVGAIR